MAILRAGPYASSIDSFLNELTPQFGLTPVNCAMDTSSTAWPWRYLFRGNDDIYTYEDGLPSDSQSDTGSLAAGGSNSNWRYQASVATSFDLTYDVQANGAEEFDTVDISVSINGSVVFSDGSTSNPGDGAISISGTETINLPIAVVPTLVSISASFFAEGDAAGSGSLSYTVS